MVARQLGNHVIEQEENVVEDEEESSDQLQHINIQPVPESLGGPLPPNADIQIYDQEME